jgi:hypothetical protein
VQIKHIIYIFLVLILAVSGQKASAQDDKKSDRQRSFTRDSIPELDLNRDTTKAETKRKAKAKKRIFYGKKCKKGFTKKGKREKQVIETFWYLKKFELPDAYIKDIYVFDMKDRKILERDEILETDKTRYKILHGPYKRTVGKDPVEMGIFYVGMKHGRWEKFGKGFILLDKVRYYRGWQRDAEITYYDNDKKKIKEVLPYKYKALQGVYYLFAETGQVLVHGKYQDDKKIGMWVEYFAENGRRKKETSYPKDLYKGEQFAPKVMNEWDDNGNPIIKDGKPFDPSQKVKRPPSSKKKTTTTEKENTPAKKVEDKTDNKTTEKTSIIAPEIAPQLIDTSTTPKAKPTKEEIKKRLEKKMR